MPIETLEQQQANAPIVTPTPGLPTGGATPPPPPGLIPSPLNMPTGLRGKARWDALLRQAPYGQDILGGLFSQGNRAWQRWVAALPDDPSDPEYQALLDLARKMDSPPPRPGQGPPTLGGPAAQSAGQPLAPPLGTDSGYPAAGGTAGDTVRGKYLKGTKTPGVTPTDTAMEVPEAGLSPKELKELKARNRAREKAKKTPIFKGIDPGDVLEEGPQDPYLEQFMQKKGITLDPADATKKIGSGLYVYMGKQHDPELGVDQDVYVYKEDATAALWDVNGNKLAKYQKGLGLVPTGKPDPGLQQYWDYAVAMAGNAARNGKKVSVEELFDTYINAAISQKNASGGGGGGGAAQPLGTDDYYFATMSVLGDISGVEE